MPKWQTDCSQGDCRTSVGESSTPLTTLQTATESLPRRSVVPGDTGPRDTDRVRVLYQKGPLRSLEGPLTESTPVDLHYCHLIIHVETQRCVPYLWTML